MTESKKLVKIMRRLLHCSVLTAITMGLVSSGASADPQTNKGNRNISRTRALEIARTQIPGSQHSTTIPSNFPVPVYKNNLVKTNFIHSTQGSPSASANLITKDDPAKVFKWYESVCRRDKWVMKVPTENLRSTMSAGQQFYMLDGTKGPSRIMLYCYKNPDPKMPGTMVNISWFFNKGR